MSDHLEGITILGNTVKGAISAEQLERFPAPNVSVVEFDTEEVTALCPVTEQPDIYRVNIRYKPDGWCVESKSLKLYLMSFRHQGIFGEGIAATIADDIHNALKPKWTIVEAEQQMRGGLIMTASAVRGEV